MANHHDAFKALGPIDWDTIDQGELKTFLTDTLGDAQALIDSIPVAPTKAELSKPGRPRSTTDPMAPMPPGRAPTSTDRVRELRKEWKEMQVSPKDNPLGVNIYRLAAKDKKGAWFARRSVHEGLTFERWKLGLQREFAESLKVQGKPGDGKIRGIGADKRVVNTAVDGAGKIEVYQLSAQFPGPTTPRDFVTLLLSSDCGVEQPQPQPQALGQQVRYFMVVSKPCVHPECPQRSGYIRGQYESVELIREIRTEKPLRRVRSSVDFSRDEGADARKQAVEDLGREAVMRSASRRSALAASTSDISEQDRRQRGKTISFAGAEGQQAEEETDYETLIEWLMVTRSDPGGSVPRWMVEKGTPAGIAGDANKFLKWASCASLDDFEVQDENDEKLKEDAVRADEEAGQHQSRPTIEPTTNITKDPTAQPRIVEPQEEFENAPGGLYGMIANALGVATSVVAARLPAFGSNKGGDTDSDLSSDKTIEDEEEDDDDDDSSLHSFHSFASGNDQDSLQAKSELSQDTLQAANGESVSIHSSESKKSTAASTQQEKELQKLESRRRKLQDKLEQAQQRAMAKKEADSQRDESAIAKLRERHDRELQKHESKYQRDLRKLEAKREAEQRKAEERKRKAAGREQRENLGMELEKVRAERDVAVKHIEILKEQVKELQGQNTALVSALGRMQVGGGGGGGGGGGDPGASTRDLLEGFRRVDTAASVATGKGGSGE